MQGHRLPKQATWHIIQITLLQMSDAVLVTRMTFPTRGHSHGWRCLTVPIWFPPTRWQSISRVPAHPGRALSIAMREHDPRMRHIDSQPLVHLKPTWSHWLLILSQYYQTCKTMHTCHPWVSHFLHCHPTCRKLTFWDSAWSIDTSLDWDMPHAPTSSCGAYRPSSWVPVPHQWQTPGTP